MDDSQKLAWYEKAYGPIIEERGLKNWRNLFRKPTFLEWVILFMLLMGLFLSYAYKLDMRECKSFMSNVTDNACLYCQMLTQQALYSDSPINITFNEVELTGEIGG